MAARGLRNAFRATSKEKAAALAQPEDRLYRRLSALGSKLGAVASTINTYISEGRDVKKDELDRCIREFRRYKRYPQALEMMEWMELRKLKFDLTDYGVHLDLIAKVKGIDAAENYFNELPPYCVLTPVYGSLLNSYCVEKMSDKAEALFRKMLEAKMVVQAIPYNNLMSLYIRLEMPDKVLVLWDEMKKMKVQPDSFTYNMLMRAYSLLKDVEGMERVFMEMNRVNGKLCDWTTYSNLAVAYIGGGHHVKAKLALKRLEEEMDKYDREAYHFLLSLYAKMSDLHNVLRIWDSLKSRFRVVTNSSYLIMLQALKNMDNLKEMTKCYEEWESACLRYDVRLANAVISAYLKHDMLQEAELVLQKALDGSPGQFFTTTWDLFMIYFLKNKDILRSLRMMKVPPSSEDWNMDPDKFDCLLTFLNKEHDISSVKELYKSIKEITTAPIRIRVCRSLLQAYLSG